MPMQGLMNYQMNGVSPFGDGLAGYSYSSNPNGWVNGLGVGGLGEAFSSTFSPEQQQAIASRVTPANTGIGLNIGTLGGIGSIMQGLGGLASAYTAMKGIEAAENQFNFQKGLANRNLANQAKIINNAYDSSAQAAAGLIGSVNSDGTIGNTAMSTVDSYSNKAKDRYVSGEAIR